MRVMVVCYDGVEYVLSMNMPIPKPTPGVEVIEYREAREDDIILEFSQIVK